MYLEIKTDGLRGEGRVGRVHFSKSDKTLYYKERILIKSKGVPLKANYYDQESLDDFWISNPRKDGQDSLFSSQIEIDEDVQVEYWTDIRHLPENKHKSSYRSKGKSKAEREKIEKGLRRRQMDNGWMPS